MIELNFQTIELNGADMMVLKALWPRKNSIGCRADEMHFLLGMHLTALWRRSTCLIALQMVSV